MNSMHRTYRLDAPLRASRKGPLRWIDAVFSTFRQRTVLSHLDARMLRDIGLTKGDVHRETNRSFWDIPDWWR